MSWATKYISKLQQGQTVQFRPQGNSMQGLIESGQLCTVCPCNISELKKGDIVLCVVQGQQYLHKITKVSKGKFEIGNNKGKVNGIITSDFIFGKCIVVDGNKL